MHGRIPHVALSTLWPSFERAREYVCARERAGESWSTCICWRGNMPCDRCAWTPRFRKIVQAVLFFLFVLPSSYRSPPSPAPTTRFVRSCPPFQPPEHVHHILYVPKVELFIPFLHPARLCQEICYIILMVILKSQLYSDFIYARC